MYHYSAFYVYSSLNSPDCLFYRYFQSLEGKDFVHKHLSSCSQSAAHCPGIVVIRQYPCLGVRCDGCWSVLRAVCSLPGSGACSEILSILLFSVTGISDSRSVPGGQLSLVTQTKM